MLEGHEITRDTMTLVAGEINLMSVERTTRESFMIENHRERKEGYLWWLELGAKRHVYVARRYSNAESVRIFR